MELIRKSRNFRGRWRDVNRGVFGGVDVVELWADKSRSAGQVQGGSNSENPAQACTQIGRYDWQILNPDRR